MRCHTCCWSRPLCLYYDYWGFCLCRKTKTFGHKSEATTRSCCHGARTCVRCSDRHVYSGNFIFNVFDNDIIISFICSHYVKYGRGRRHRIRSKEFATSLYRTSRDGFISRKEYSIFIIFHFLQLKFKFFREIFLYVIVSAFCSSYVIICYFLSLPLTEIITDNFVEKL